MNRCYFFLSLLFLAALPQKAFAHGASIQYRETSAIAITANYDDGKPMANAQVVIYTPSDRATPWLKGTTDEGGNFTFVPDGDPKNVGNWDIKVRQAGHGDITSIPVTGGKLAEDVSETKFSSTGADYTPAQKVVMAATGIWGFVGTALFFSRSKSAK